MVKLSIIIPYFETYELTYKLLEKLKLQNTNEIEVILIDDGCNEKRFDDFINDFKVIHQENIGVAKTRNRGIKEAKGKYIGFIDCDDMIVDNYIKTLLNAIDKYDTDVINFNWYDLSKNIEHRKPHNYAPWKAIYKKEKIPIFKENMKYGSEDVPFQDEIDSGEYTITYLDKLLYYYNSNRKGSLMWKKIEKEKNSMIKVEVLERFNLKKFNELKEIERFDANHNANKTLYIGDKFLCNKEMAEYLLGENKYNRAFVKTIEIIPDNKKSKIKK